MVPTADTGILGGCLIRLVLLAPVSGIASLRHQVELDGREMHDGDHEYSQAERSGINPSGNCLPSKDR